MAIWKRTRLCSAVLVVLALPSVSHAKTPAPKTVVVDRLAGLGVEPELMRSLEDYLRGEISRIPGYSVMSRASQEKQLASPPLRKYADCFGDVKCLQHLAQALKADFVVQGTVATFGNKIQFNVKSISINPKTAVQVESGTLQGSGQQLIPGVRLIAHRLFAPQLIVAYLRVDVGMKDIELEIDGKVAGVTPFATPLRVKPGPHIVSMRRHGYSPLQIEIMTHPFQTTVVNAVPDRRK